MNRTIRAVAAVLLSFSLLLCTGCSSLFPYESPEDQQQNNQNNFGPSTDEKDTPIDIDAIRSDDLVYTATLRNSAGSVLATYEGSVPTFLAPSGYAVSFQRINEHFRIQFNAFQQDCEAYFNRVKQHYGKNWDTVTVTDTPFKTSVTCQMFAAPAHYMSMEFVYSTCLDGETQKIYRLGEVLLLDTGWVLQAEELFGSKYAEAQSRVLADVTQWAVEKNIIAAGSVVTFTADALLKNFALTQTQLVLYLDAYCLSASDRSAHVVYLDLEDYADLITDLKLPEGSKEDGADKPLAPDNNLLPQLPGATARKN
jgi:hypothetical protein